MLFSRRHLLGAVLYLRREDWEGVMKQLIQIISLPLSELVIRDISSERKLCSVCTDRARDQIPK